MFLPEKMTESTDEKCLLLWYPFVEEEVKKLMPEIIVCDTFSRNAAIAGIKLGIPVVLNIPFSVNFLDEWGILGSVTLKNAKVCCGQVCIA